MTAVRRLEALDFTFHSAHDLEKPEAFDDLIDRLRLIVANPKLEETAAMPLLGAVEAPQTTITQAFRIYVDDIVCSELVDKSKVQRDQWEKVKLRAVNNFVQFVSGKPMVEITIDDAKKVYRGCRTRCRIWRLSRAKIPTIRARSRPSRHVGWCRWWAWRWPCSSATSRVFRATRTARTICRRR